jgi:hypothetical protein
MGVHGLMPRMHLNACGPDRGTKDSAPEPDDRDCQIDQNMRPSNQ